MREYGIKMKVSGLRSRRGRAEVKYQCQGDVPQADAPSDDSDGKILERKAESSGQSAVGDCQKNVSIGMVRARPMSRPNIPAGRRAFWRKTICDCTDFPACVKWRYKLWEANRSANSDRKMTVASVRRYVARRIRFTWAGGVAAGSGKSKLRAKVPETEVMSKAAKYVQAEYILIPKAKMFGSVREA